MTILRTLFAILKVLLAILGCLVFLFSIISPFALSFGSLAPISNRFWSYEGVTYARGERQYWFINYWDLDFPTTMSWVLVSMFIFQLLTLAFGVGSIFFNKRVLSIAPVLLCLGVLGLMKYAANSLYLALGGLQQGFYLVFPSLALFILACILNEVIIRKNASLEKK